MAPATRRAAEGRGPRIALRAVTALTLLRPDALAGRAVAAGGAIAVACAAAGASTAAGGDGVDTRFGLR